MSVRKSSHGTIFLIVSSGSPRALIASSLRSTSKKPFCPMTRSLHPPMTACGHRVRFAATWREEFFEVPICKLDHERWHSDDHNRVGPVQTRGTSGGLRVTHPAVSAGVTDEIERGNAVVITSD